MNKPPIVAPANERVVFWKKITLLLITILIFISCNNSNDKRNKSYGIKTNTSVLDQDWSNSAGDSAFSEFGNPLSINKAIISESTRKEIVSTFGEPDSTITLESFCGLGQGNEYNLYYKSSYFKIFDGKLWGIDIRDSGYCIQSRICIGDSTSILKKHFPLSYMNMVTDEDKFNLNYDEVFWISSVDEGDGLYVLCNDKIIERFYYMGGCD